MLVDRFREGIFFGSRRWPEGKGYCIFGCLRHQEAEPKIYSPYRYRVLDPGFESSMY